MEGAEQRLTDCHYYLLGSCNKGAECPFRHSAGAKRNKVECENWGSPEGCADTGCSFRHPARPKNNSNKDRSAIPCYWESQPSGCTKGTACAFKHSKNDASEAAKPSKSGEKRGASASDAAAAPRVLKINRPGTDKTSDKSSDQQKPAAPVRKLVAKPASAAATVPVRKLVAKMPAKPEGDVPPSTEAPPKRKAIDSADAVALSPASAKPAVKATSKTAKPKATPKPASSSTDASPAVLAKPAAPTIAAPVPAAPAVTTPAKTVTKAAPKASTPVKAKPAPMPAPPPAPVADPEEDDLARLERELEEVGVKLGQ